MRDLIKHIPSVVCADGAAAVTSGEPPGLPYFTSLVSLFVSLSCGLRYTGVTLFCQLWSGLWVKMAAMSIVSTLRGSFLFLHFLTPSPFYSHKPRYLHHLSEPRVRGSDREWVRDRKREERLFFLWSNLYFDADQCMCASFCISKYTMQPIFTPNPSNPTAVLVSSPMLLSSIGTSLAQLLEVTLKCSSIKSKRSPGRRGRMDGPTERL